MHLSGSNYDLDPPKKIKSALGSLNFSFLSIIQTVNIKKNQVTVLPKVDLIDRGGARLFLQGGGTGVAKFFFLNGAHINKKKLLCFSDLLPEKQVFGSFYNPYTSLCLCVSLCLPVCLLVFLYICLSVCLFVSLSLTHSNIMTTNYYYLF